MHKWSKEEIDFLRENAKGTPIDGLRQYLNYYFGLDITKQQIQSIMKRYNITNGRVTRFSKNHTPANKGKKYPGKINSGCFKIGSKPKNTAPVGTEIIRPDGYLYVKVASPNAWNLKHRLVWEDANGPIEDGNVLLFLDQDRSNVKLENLCLITKQERLVLNRKGLIYTEKELTKSGIAIAKLNLLIQSKKDKEKKL